MSLEARVRSLLACCSGLTTRQIARALGVWKRRVAVLLRQMQDRGEVRRERNHRRVLGSPAWTWWPA